VGGGAGGACGGGDDAGVTRRHVQMPDQRTCSLDAFTRNQTACADTTATSPRWQSTMLKFQYIGQFFF